MEILEIPLNLENIVINIIKEDGRIYFITTWSAEGHGDFYEKDLFHTTDDVIFGRGKGGDRYNIRIDLSKDHDNVQFLDGPIFHSGGLRATILIDSRIIRSFVG
ncbi:MAG: hypothetical protein WCQ00_03465 [bacterium]